MEVLAFLLYNITIQNSPYMSKIIYAAAGKRDLPCDFANVWGGGLKGYR